MSGGFPAAITAVGAFVPERKLTNAQLEGMVDTTDEWIVQRTGIRERRVVSEGESTGTMATEAARRALAQAGLDPARLEMIICATITPETYCPSTACYVQRDLGATAAAAFDVSAACSGFIYALTIARRMIECGQIANCLIMGAETLSRVTDYTDRGSCILFGDGAGAAVLQRAADPDRCVKYTTIHSDGGGWDLIYMPAGGSRMPASHATVDDKQHYLKFRGREVYKFAVGKMQWVLEDCMKACGLTAETVDLVVPHQVNMRIIDSATERLNFPKEKVFVNIDRYGNTSAASIPIALEEAVRTGRAGPGKTVLMVAFGAGLTWSGAVVKL